MASVVARRDKARRRNELPVLAKSPTGITGFDEITNGGLPRGRTTLICGGAGCGKTLFGMHFLVRGAVDYGEPGVFVAFEEREEDLVKNVASLGFDLVDLQARKLLALDHVYIDASQIEENGEYDLEGLFLRLESAIDSIGAKRVVIDTLETLFGGLSNYAVLRAELRRLFSWLKDKGVTAIITAERGEGTLTRHGLEEYVSDCVVVLDHRVHDQLSTRRVRVVKYRGTTHGTNENPFLISETGITVVPASSTGLSHVISDERVSSGVEKLDAMLGGNGYFRGSTVLVSGTAGAGKSSLAAHLADSTCARGERCLYVSYEESPEQIVRNMRSVGFGLDEHVKKKGLRLVAHRPTSAGLEGHLAVLHKEVEEFAPTTVVIDPIGALLAAGVAEDAHSVAMRLIDFLKGRGITTLLTTLTHGGEALEHTSMAVSSLVDTWLLVKTIEQHGERNRGLYVLKSRGMNHSNQIREFGITSHGIELIDPYVGPEGVFTGTARVAQENRERAEKVARHAETERMERLLQHKRSSFEQRMAALRADFAAEELEMRNAAAVAAASEAVIDADRVRMGALRGAPSAEPKAQRAPRGTSGRPKTNGRHPATP